ncbi:hypothetical protein DOM22_09515 [Bdellovibrio sp. ZAP7]|uniref:hypothetical protein n=1 Tax=Bdellovibrio sp. ZAP7 TaxID=2231053 RepID=UPI00115B5F49|nr:hypothetical protein [Bdellovibrio sp. ZAP7]QDK45373.1 hypothetical protein DOM22_09515 [Bdellovibrio sp. ZAP7]
MKFAKYFVFCLFLSSTAHAYLSIIESAEVLPSNLFQFGVEPQILTNRESGANFNIFAETGFNDSTSGRLTLGGGSIDFNAFASVKWVPFPDVANQPAMGLRFGAGIAREKDENIVQLQVAPLVSKKFDTEYGLTVPYLAIPFTYLNTKDDNYVATNLAVGTEWHHPELKDTMTLGAELGVDLNKSYTYISIFATFPFETSKGFGR